MKTSGSEDASDGDVDALLGSLRRISLEALDDRAALLRRVDNKYLLQRDQLVRLLRHAVDHHDVLEIDGRRRFAYRSVYFDTRDLRAFHDHVAGRRPRFKLRTRCYLDAGSCQFEVKVTTGSDETDKHQADHPADASERLGEDARRLIEATLHYTGAEPARDLIAVLTTEFDRFTLAARAGGSRMTCDLGLRLCCLNDGSQALLDPARVVVETKSGDGCTTVDRLLSEMGIAPISMSKYRMGIDLLVERDPTGKTGPLRKHFS